ncbi:MAG TPA: HEPN domain-containing protein [Candidatus Cloacimonetes bacterium]|nr:HEPN domain-containing protein [Candidatus Cloacimonadota bacterium]
MLNDFSIEIRYPGEIIEPTKEEVMEAIEATEKIMNYVKRKLENE